MASSILIHKLIVVGVRKNYTVKFNPGVNIIYGDSATGKSSILELIDYLLGSKHFDTYPEIESAGRYAVLDVSLNQNRYSIKRDIFNASKLIEVYSCKFEEISQYPVKRYLPNFNTSPEDIHAEFFSDFLLNSLNLQNIKIKQAPSKDDSKLVRLSFRDIFKYCYINQDDLGSKKFLKPDDYSLQARYAEVFKYIFNALDSQISEMAQSISEKSQEKNSIEKKFLSVSEFLRDSDFGNMSSLDDEITKTDEEILLIGEQITLLNNSVITDNEAYNAIKSTLLEVELEKRVCHQSIIENERKVEIFTRLKNDYINDITKFKSSILSKSIIGEIPKEVLLCPVCDNTLDLDGAKKKFEITVDEKINQEISLLKRRVRDTEQLILESKNQWELEKLKLRELDQQEQKARELIEQNTKELASPYLAERDMYVSQLGGYRQKRSELVSRIKIRNQHALLSESMKHLEASIESLKEILEKLKEKAPSMIDVLSDLADNLKKYLVYIKIKDPTGISLTKDRFSPVVRGIEYKNITSGGLRTIIGIGYLCSLLEQALTTPMSYPTFLMIDTVGKYLGKTKTQSRYINETSQAEDSKEGVSDPIKYQNIFEYIIQLAEKYEGENRICQFILVDNDVPDHIVDQLYAFIVAHFSSERVDGLPVGFIDDAKV